MPVLSEGPNSGSTFVDDSSVGTITWTNPGRAAVSDDNRAIATLGTAEVSHYLKATNFGFSIPNSAKIVGIEFKIERRGGAIIDSNRIEDNSIKLVKGGTISGNDKADTTEWVTGSGDEIKTYGSNSDLWGLTWTPANINDNAFGVVVSAKQVGTGPSDAEIDHVTLTVFYIERGTLISMTQTI